MTERLVISNLNQFMQLAAKNPAILNIGGFAFLRPRLTVNGCGKCGRAQAILNEQRPQWEATFSVLSATEQNQLKNLLDAKQVCYYIKQPNGQLKLNCF
jgi:hypothetical protein